MWQRANGFFDCTARMFVEPQKETYLYFIKNFLQFEHILEAIKNFEHKNIYFVPILWNFYYLQKNFMFSISFLFITNECLKEYWYGASGPGCSKLVNFCRTEAGLTSKWGRISPAVYWWHQKQCSYIVRRRATSRNGIKVFGLHTHALTYSQSHVWRQACCLKNLIEKFID